MSALPWRKEPEGLSLTVKLTPRGGRDRIEGLGEDAEGRPLLLARVSAAPTDGEANAALMKLVGKAAGAPKSAVSITSGATSRIKRLMIGGDTDALIAKLKSSLPKEK